MKIIVVLVLTVSAGRVSAQDAAVKPLSGGHSVSTLPGYDFKKWRNKTYLPGDINSFQENLTVDKEPVLRLSPSYQVLPAQRMLPGSGYSFAGVPIRQDLYVSNFGFFCRKELQVEKATRLPLRFRLGSLAQCNQLEQKY